MTKLDLIIDELAQTLQNLPEVKAFFDLRQQILIDPFLNEQQTQMKHHQKLMMKHLSETEIYQTHQKAYQLHQRAFDEHPLVINYVSLKEQLSPLIEQLQTIIE
jgi:cell fate (sporulation/competence/biofilm development) regulator YmcA (YheA/YmcA/DUF963 family)